MSRITINCRHTGRFYIGCDMEAFFAIYGLVLTYEGVRDIFPYTFQKAPNREALDRFIRAMKSHVAKIRQEADAASSVPVVPSVPQPSTP